MGVVWDLPGQSDSTRHCSDTGKIQQCWYKSSTIHTDHLMTSRRRHANTRRHLCMCNNEQVRYKRLKYYRTMSFFYH